MDKHPNKPVVDRLHNRLLPEWEAYFAALEEEIKKLKQEVAILKVKKK